MLSCKDMWAGKRTLLCVRGLLVCADKFNSSSLAGHCKSFYFRCVAWWKITYDVYIVCCLESRYRHKSAESSLKALNGACFVYVK